MINSDEIGRRQFLACRLFFTRMARTRGRCFFGAGYRKVPGLFHNRGL